jgi:hypothetical protein
LARLLNLIRALLSVMYYYDVMRSESPHANVFCLERPSGLRSFSYVSCVIHVDDAIHIVMFTLSNEALLGKL